MSAPLDPGRAAMLELFRAEVASHGLTILAGLDRISTGVVSPQSLEPVVRGAQAIKGGALLLGLHPAGPLAEALESCLAAVLRTEGAPPAAGMATLRTAVELLRAAAEVSGGELEAWFGARAGEAERLAAELRAIGEAVAGRAAVPPPAAQVVAAAELPVAAAGPPAPAQAHPSPLPTAKPARRAPARRLESAAGATAQDLRSASLFDLFRLEVDGQTQMLMNGLLALEEDPGAGGIEALMRAAHSLKGAARVVQLDPVVRLAHTLEDCLVAAREGRIQLSSDGIDLLLAAVDLLAGVGAVGEAEVGPWLEQQSGAQAEVIRAMEAYRSGAAAGAWRRAEGPPTPVLAPAAGEREAAPSPPEPIAGGAAEPAPAPPRGEPQASREVRISAENLDRLMGLAGESLVQAGWLETFGSSLMELKKAQDGLAGVLESCDPAAEETPAAELGDAWQRARERVNACRADVLERIDDLSTFSRRAVNLSSLLYRAVIASRMRPFEDAVGGFRRLVRDLARTLGKRVKLEIRGLRTDVDRDIVDKLEAPLNHLLRNAVDHGIESAEERLAAGKPEVGSILVDARHRAGKLVITVADDGRGIDLDRLRSAIRGRRLASEEMVGRMEEPELLEFLFLPGFSTAERVTEISGRGVGLDVVQAMVQEVGGNLRATTRAGQGMTFSFELPLTRSVMRTLLVEVAGEPLAIPIARIDRILKIAVDEVDVVEDRQYYRFDGANIGLVAAHQVLELGEYQSEEEVMSVVVLSDQMNRYGLVVDRFIGEHDLVVRPIDRRLGKVADIAAVAVLPSGPPVLIVDVDDLVRSVDNLVTGRRLRKIGRVAHEVVHKRVLVVDDSLTVREVERQLLENRGYEVDVAVDGMDAWNAVLAAPYDLVISDIDMPRMTGFELVERIKADPQHSSVPVIIVSYKDREEDRLHGLEAGADYYLTKGSFHDDTLLQAVVDLIGSAAS